MARPTYRPRGAQLEPELDKVVVAEVRGDWYEKRKMCQSLSYLWTTNVDPVLFSFFSFFKTSTSIIILMIVHFCKET